MFYNRIHFDIPTFHKKHLMIYLFTAFTTFHELVGTLTEHERDKTMRRIWEVKTENMGIVLFPQL